MIKYVLSDTRFIVPSLNTASLTLVSLVLVELIGYNPFHRFHISLAKPIRFLISFV